MPHIDPELASEVRQYKKRKKPLGVRVKKNCCCLGLFILIASILIGVAAIAKSGVVQIPVFSKLFYRAPDPNVIVKEIVVESPKILDEDVLDSKVITQDQLSVLLQATLTKGEDPFFSDNLQALISSSSVEITGSLLKPIAGDVELGVMPKVANYKLSIEIISAKLGGFKMPKFILGLVSKSLIEPQLKQLNQTADEFGKIESVELSEGIITISGYITKPQ